MPPCADPESPVENPRRTYLREATGLLLPPIEIQEAAMKAQRTLVFAILFLTTLAVGSRPAEAAPPGTDACARQTQALVAPAMSLPQAAAPAPVEALFASVRTETEKSPGLGECLQFCMIAYCPEGTTCGPSPGGGCGCNPNGIGTV